MAEKKERTALDKLTDTIIRACRECIKNAPFDKTMKAVVMDKVTNSDHLYRVQMNGEKYTIPSSIMIEKFPCSVWVMAPRGNYNNMFVLAMRSSQFEGKVSDENVGEIEAITRDEISGCFEENLIR